MDLSYEGVKKIYSDKGFPFDERIFGINILGIRKSLHDSNLFDDTCIIAYKTTKDNVCLEFDKFTTEPGYYFLKVKFMNPKGCAWVKEGYYPKLWTNGLHGEKQYPALIQYSPITVYRDTNMDEVLDNSGGEETGMFGIDFHHGYNCTLVYNNSAGCQVLENIADLAQVLPLFQLHERTYGKGISYALIDSF